MHFRKNDFRNEKIMLDKGTKRATNSVFVVWQNGRVWKRNPEWVAEQDSDRKPVGEPSNNSSLRPRAYQLNQPSWRRHEVCGNGDHDHEGQKPRCQQTIAAQRTSHLYLVCRR